MLSTNSCRRPCPIPTTSWCTTIPDPSFADALAQLVYDCPKMWDGKRYRGFFHLIRFISVGSKYFSECIIWESDAYPCLFASLSVCLSGRVESTPNVLSLNIYYLIYHVSFTFRFVDAFLIDSFQMENDNFIIGKNGNIFPFFSTMLSQVNFSWKKAWNIRVGGEMNFDFCEAKKVDVVGLTLNQKPQGKWDWTLKSMKFSSV